MNEWIRSDMASLAPRTQRGLSLGRGVIYALVASLLLSSALNLYQALHRTVQISVAIPEDFCFGRQQT